MGILNIDLLISDNNTVENIFDGITNLVVATITYRDMVYYYNEYIDGYELETIPTWLLEKRASSVRVYETNNYVPGNRGVNIVAVD